MNKFKHIILIILVNFIILFIGVFGYMGIEGYQLLDAFYMTIITLTTTGFMEVKPLGPEGKLFTSLLLILGMGVIAYSVTTFFTTLFNINWQDRRKKKMEEKFQKFNQHTLICGHGRLGKIIAGELSQITKEVIIIEKDESKKKQLEENKLQYIIGDCTSDETLIKANIVNAKILVSLLDNDADTLYLTLAARSLNKNLKIIARANDENAKMRILRAGASDVILPMQISAKKIAHRILFPEIETIFELQGLSLEQSGAISLVDNIVSDPNLKVIGDFAQKHPHQVIVGIKTQENQFTFNPTINQKIVVGDVVLTLVQSEGLN